MSGFEHNLAAVQPTTCSERRHDVDALRVFLFGLLIWLHFVSLCTWTQEPAPLHMNTLAMLIMGIMHQWRLAALFVISGMGTAFAFGHRTWQTYLSERVIRLLVPLVFATYVLLGGFADPVDTTSRFFEIFPGISRMPYGHLWFIYNLLLYSVVLTPLFVYVRRNPDGRLTHGLRTLMTMPFAAGLLIAPPLLFAVSDVLCKPWARGEVGMWWEFPRYFLYFAVGYLLISVRHEYFAALERMRYALIPLTVILTVIFVMSESLFGVPDLAIGGWVNQGYPAFSFWAALGAFALELHAWVWCLFIFAWAAKFLNRPSRWIDYLNQAVYCSYIVHLTMALLAAAVVYRLKLEYTPGLVTGLVIQTFFCLAFFEIAKRSRLGQVLFGIKLPILSTTTETVGVWWSRLSAATSVVVLCCTVFGLVVYGWQIGKRHFVPIRASQERAIQASEATVTYVSARQSPDIASDIDALVQVSCIHCHDANTETALNLESLSGDLSDPESMRKWVHVFDRVRNGTMPPESEARPDTEIVVTFAERAFRRPGEHAEIESFIELARPAIEEGLPFEEVIRVPLRSIPRFRKTVVVCKRGGSYEEFLKDCDVHIESLGVHWRKSTVKLVASVPRLARAIRHFDPDIVFSIMDSANVFCGLAHRLSRHRSKLLVDIQVTMAKALDFSPKIFDRLGF